MMYLLLSLGLVACTPLLVAGVDRYRSLSQVFAFLLLAVITYNIFAHILVENIEIFGWSAWLAFFCGLALFSYGDHKFFAEPHKASGFFIPLLHIFLFFHSVTDGAALIEGNGHGPHQGHLSQSVILHRLIFEVFLWKFFLERFGRRSAILVLVNVAIGTICGFFASRAVFSHTPVAFGLFEAFMGGALFHLVYDYLKERLAKVRLHHKPR